MNNFHPDQETRAEIETKGWDKNIDLVCFRQSRHPRLWATTPESVVPTHLEMDKEYWCPPGHLEALIKIEHHLEDLEKKGIRYLFFSNIDNLGVLPHARLIHYLEEKKLDLLVEATEKTPLDRKGGGFIRAAKNTGLEPRDLPRQDSAGIKLVERSQIPPESIEVFDSLKLFNTNSCWISIAALKEILKQNVLDACDIIVNRKKLHGKPVLQLERALGSRFEHFRRAEIINVPRDRFLPVKTLEDLFRIQSDLYDLKSPNNRRLILNPHKTLPLVNFHGSYKDVEAFQEAFPHLPHRTQDLTRLEIWGPVKMTASTIFEGEALYVAEDYVSSRGDEKSRLNQDEKSSSS
jgi:UTP--glucose-1-phosphate uridylyltransferase